VTDLFVYGTLMSQGLMAQVAGLRLPLPVAAVLPDHCVFMVAGDVIASIAPMPGAQAQGLIWPDRPAAASAILAGATPRPAACDGLMSGGCGSTHQGYNERP